MTKSELIEAIEEIIEIDGDTSTDGEVVDKIFILTQEEKTKDEDSLDETN
jgi:broad-specificity NMP kinase|tara:strand:- start:1149 stop:1298 length:150 start_codon:yes stop_codon:yes gene_type:complete